MEFLKNHYEKVCLGAALAILLAWCVFLAASLSAVNRHIEQMKPRLGMGSERGIPGIQADQVFVGMKAVNDPKTDWKLMVRGTGRGTLFDPPRYVWCAKPECRHLLPSEYNVCPYCKTIQVRNPENAGNVDSDMDGMSDLYEKKYPFLSANDPRDAARDFDEDGFTNLEEFRAGTDPGDPASHPSYTRKLRLLVAVRNPLPLKLEKISREGGSPAEWQLQFKVGGKSKFCSIRDDETLEGFKLVSLKPKVRVEHDKATKIEQEVDISELTIQRGKEEPLILIPGKIGYESGVKVKFIFLTAAEVNRCQIIDTQIGGEFTLVVGKGAKETYKVVEASPAQATIQPVGGKDSCR